MAMSYSSLSTIRKAQSGDIQARNRVVEEHRGLVWMVVHRIPERGIMSKDDLAQEGFLALMRAIDLFDADKGFRFSTYASNAIHREVVRALQNYGTTIRIPVAHHHKDMDDEYHNLMYPASFNAPVGDDGAEFADFLADERAEAEFESLFGDGIEIGSSVLNPGAFLESLSVLTEIQRDVIERRFGLNGHEPHTLAQIGQATGKTSQAIRYAEKAAFKKLRAHWNVEDVALKAQADSRRKLPTKAMTDLIRRLSAEQRNEIYRLYAV